MKKYIYMICMLIINVNQTKATRTSNLDTTVSTIRGNVYVEMHVLEELQDLPNYISDEVEILYRKAVLEGELKFRVIQSKKVKIYIYNKVITSFNIYDEEDGWI